jgi:hypothetical protein
MVSSTVIALLSPFKPASLPWGLIQASSRQDGFAKSDMSAGRRFGESFAALSNLMLGNTAASTIQPQSFLGRAAAPCRFFLLLARVEYLDGHCQGIPPTWPWHAWVSYAGGRADINIRNKGLCLFPCPTHHPITPLRPPLHTVSEPTFVAVTQHEDLNRPPRCRRGCGCPGELHCYWSWLRAPQRSLVSYPIPRVALCALLTLHKGTVQRVLLSLRRHLLLRRRLTPSLLPQVASASLTRTTGKIVDISRDL